MGDVPYLRICSLSAIVPCFAVKRHGSILHSPGMGVALIRTGGVVLLFFFPPGSAEAHNQPPQGA